VRCNRADNAKRPPAARLIPPQAARRGHVPLRGREGAIACAAVAEEWGRLNVPDPLPVIGGLLAATAKANRLTLATRNTAGLARSGAALFNPWDGSPGS
jgi:predicted nucleic acid-binding protein